MKKIVVALVALLLIAGGGAAAYFYLFSTPAEAAVGEEGEAAKAEDHAKEEKGKGGGHGESAYTFVELDPLILPIVDDNGLSQTVSLVVVLEVADAAAGEEVKALTPRIKDAFIQDMYGMLNRHAALKGGVIQVDYLKHRLNEISQKVVEGDKIHDVLLQVVQQRPI